MNKIIILTMCTLFNFNYHDDFDNIESIYDIKIYSIQRYFLKSY